jgi:hypothetical protein
MPRYFFDIHDGRSEPDQLGTELRDIYAAQAESIRAAGTILRDMGAKFWDDREWRMEVRNESRKKLFTLHAPRLCGRTLNHQF